MSADRKKEPKASAGFLRSMLAVTRKDLSAELRSPELILAMLVFALLVIFIFNFALDLEPGLRTRVSSGVLWSTFAFAGTLGLNRSMSIEKENGSLDGLLLAPVDRAAIYFGKVISNLIFLFVLEVIVLPVYSLLYGINLFNQGLLLVIFLGSLGYIVVGTLLSSMAVQARTRDILLPILQFPIVLPLLIASIKASSGYLTGADFSSIFPWINLLIIFDLIFMAIALMVFDYVVEE